ncbi:YceI family protein [Wielerella bovis]|uniref:YceI family protein n=1 Tax=Wielerella bovis TaxID=2917790 RepID=UPI0020199F7A|nr:YceI family protein [Wielerella bovis]ULJ63422.1 YceI family protein [Wielerella bovis]
MKKIIAATVLAFAAVSATAASYEIDPKHTNARFMIDHFGTSSNVGGVYEIEGSMEFNPAKRTGSVDITLPLANLRSSSDAFTGHLKSADLFHADKFPEMRFQSTKFHFVGKKVVAVSGNLTLLGKTHPVKLRANKFNCYNSPMLKTEVCGGDFTTTIDRTKWGMDYLVSAGMSKKVRLDIQIEAAKNN